jgi:23S rRNA pseudouridine1911/1915/1917 synthase
MKARQKKTRLLKVDAPAYRLDKYLSQHFSDLSRARLQKLIEEGNVLVNKKSVRASHPLKSGDLVSVVLPQETTSAPAPQPIPLDIVYEDKDIIVVNKPAGLTVHPAPGHEQNTLVNAILSRYPDMASFSGSDRPGIVHRLDKDTSGLIVIARNKKTQEELIKNFKSREVKKVYITLVKGKLEPEHGVIDAPIGRHPVHRQRMAVVSDGREAKTVYRVVRYLDSYTLLEVMPQTGRTHQIRVHLAAIGFPVVGDRVYGVKSPFLKRQFLHAYKLGFNLPSSGAYREFTADLPDDLKSALDSNKY